MKNNSITFLGTGTSTGIPMIGCQCSLCRSTDPKDKRLRSSAYIQYESFDILIDCGPDFRYQALKHNITNIDALLITHKHKDHTGGLDDLRALNFYHHSPISIYCEEEVLQSIKQEYSYAFDEHPYPGAPQFDIHIIKNEPFTISKGDKKLTINPVRVMHYKMPVLAFRIGDLCYLTDASRIDEAEYEKLKGLNLFTINCVNRTHHISHFSLNEALQVIEKVGAKQSYITHLSHMMAEDEKGIDGRHQSLEKELPKGVYLAYDGLKIEI